jgi:hypothetical protein
MGRKCHTAEQIIARLREAEVELACVLGNSTTAIEAQVHESFLAWVGGDERLLEPFGPAVES